MLDPKTETSLSAANISFAQAAQVADRNGRALITKDGKPKYLLIDLEQEPLLYDLTDDELLEIASKRILNQYRPAFEELAK